MILEAVVKHVEKQRYFTLSSVQQLPYTMKAIPCFCIHIHYGGSIYNTYLSKGISDAVSAPSHVMIHFVLSVSPRQHFLTFENSPTAFFSSIYLKFREELFGAAKHCFWMAKQRVCFFQLTLCSNTEFDCDPKIYAMIEATTSENRLRDVNI